MKVLRGSIGSAEIPGFAAGRLGAEAGQAEEEEGRRKGRLELQRVQEAGAQAQARAKGEFRHQDAQGDVGDGRGGSRDVLKWPLCPWCVL